MLNIDLLHHKKYKTFRSVSENRMKMCDVHAFLKIFIGGTLLEDIDFLHRQKGLDL